MESACAESLRSQRDEALGDLRERFGSDAIERAAFALFASSMPKTQQIGGGGGGGKAGGSRWRGRRQAARGSREPASDEGGRGGNGDGHGHDEGSGGESAISDDSSSSGGCGDVERQDKIPVSMIAEALKPAYGPDCDDYKYDDGVHVRRGVGVGGKRGEVFVSLTNETVEEAVKACGVDCSTLGEQNGRGLRLGYEEFLAVANRLKATQQQVV